MLKQIFEFIGTGLGVIIGYLLYTIFSFAVTIAIGVPIGLGIKFIIHFVNVLSVKWGI